MADPIITGGNDCPVRRSNLQQSIDRTAQSTCENLDVKLQASLCSNPETVLVSRFLNQTIQSDRKFAARSRSF